MCRMIFGAGKIDVSVLIDDMIQMASNKNESHEENAGGIDFKHGDGWGIAYLIHEKLKIFRSVNAIYEDPQVDQFRSIETPLAIIHTRKASKGIKSIENVHPFDAVINNRQYVFFHNGTIKEELPFEEKFTLQGTTDSENYFYYMISGLNHEQSCPCSHIIQKMNRLEKYTGANFIFTDGQTTFLSSWYSLNPLYYTMKLMQDDDKVLISSEVLPQYQQNNWRKLNNRDILKISTTDLKLEFCYHQSL